MNLPGPPLLVRIGVVVLAAALVACSGGEGPDAGASSGAGASLAVVTVKLAQVPRETAFDGVVEAVNQATVAAQTSGRVVELPFDVGDYVEKGAVIARFTGSEQRARTEASDAAVTEARARLAESQLEFDRIKDVFERKLVAKARFDKAAADLESARARAEAAEAADDRLLALNEAIEKFSRQHPVQADLVKLRYFAGMTHEEVAQALNVSLSTAKNYWTFSRAWLLNEILNPSETA